MADKPKSQKLYFDLTGQAGLAPRWFGDEGDTIMQHPELRYVGSEGQLSAGVFNPDRKYSYMAPPSNTYMTVTESDATTDFTNEWRATIYDSISGSYYMAENGNLIWGGPYTGDLSKMVNAFAGSAIPGTDVRVTDLESYQVNGVHKIFFTYQRSSPAGGDMGIFGPASGGSISSNDFTWLSTTTSGAFTLNPDADHFLVTADNGFMYIGDGNYVHKVDGTTLTGGTNGTVTPQVLVTSATYVFTDGVDFKGFLWLTVVDNPATNGQTGTFASNTAGVYVWDRQTTVANTDDFIPVRGVLGIRKIWVTQAGKVRILCMSSKRTIQIREYNGTVFDTIAESAFVSYPLYRDCVSPTTSLTYWFGNDGRMYAHGNTIPGSSNEQLYIVGDMTSVVTGGFGCGAILFFDFNSDLTKVETGLFFSMKDSAVKNRYWRPNDVTRNPAPGPGNVYTLVKFFPFPAKVNYVRVYHKAGTGTGATVQGTLDIYLNQSTTTSRTASITRDDINKGWKYIPINQGAKNAVFGIQAKVAWSTGVSMADATDWMPRLLEVDYEELPKLL